MLNKIYFDNFVRLNRGFDLPDNRMQEGEFPVVASTNIKGYHNEYKIEPPVVVTGRSGSLGNVQYITDKCWPLNTTLYSKDFRGNNPHYIYYYLQTMHLEQYNAGAGVPTLNQNHLQRLKVLVHPIDEQDKIAFILSTYDSLIEANNKRIKLLEQMAEELYKEWFVRFRFPGYETAEFKNGIPKGWEYKTVEGLSCVLQRGISPDYDDDGEYSVISQKCIRQSIMDFSEARKHTKKFKSELNILDGDTVICSTGTGTLGRVGQVYGAYQNTTFDSHVTLVRANNDVGSHFLFWALKNMQPWFMNMGIGSTNQQELYRSTIKNAKILVPDEASNLTERFDRYIDPIHKQICILRDKTQNLIIQRDLLLPRLMSGKLEV